MFNKGAKQGCTNKKDDFGLKMKEKNLDLMCKEKKLADIYTSGKKREHVAKNIFLILEWNLMRWAEICVNIKTDYVYFLYDRRQYIYHDITKTQERPF